MTIWSVDARSLRNAVQSMTEEGHRVIRTGDLGSEGRRDRYGSGDGRESGRGTGTAASRGVRHCLAVGGKERPLVFRLMKAGRTMMAGDDRLRPGTVSGGVAVVEIPGVLGENLRAGIRQEPEGLNLCSERRLDPSGHRTEIRSGGCGERRDRNRRSQDQSQNRRQETPSPSGTTGRSLFPQGKLRDDRGSVFHANGSFPGG
jgi:hypothetical protein